MNKFWRQYSPYWHIITGMILAIYVTFNWIHDVSGYDKRLTTVETITDQHSKTLERLSTRIDDLWHDNGHKE